ESAGREVKHFLGRRAHGLAVDENAVPKARIGTGSDRYGLVEPAHKCWRLSGRRSRWLAAVGRWRRCHAHQKTASDPPGRAPVWGQSPGLVVLMGPGAISRVH